MNLPNKQSRFYIVQDTHFWDKNLANRKDYEKECEEIFNYIIKILEECATEKKYLLFLGDIFHAKFKNEISFNKWIQKFLVLRSKCNGIFSVVGNHELTYIDHNPFWSLMSEIESEQVLALGCKALGDLPILRVVDYLDIYNYRFNFNHHGSSIANLTSDKNILLCHNYWLSDDLKHAMDLTGEMQANSKYFSYNEINDECDLKFFDEVYLGHNHMMIGDYEFKWDDPDFPKSNVHFCGSLGLTNKNEVLHTPDTRKIYYLDILGEDKCECNHLVYSLSKKFNETLDTLQVEENIEKYKTAKYKKSLIKKYDLTLMDPIQAIEEDLKNDIDALELFKELGKGSVPDWMRRLI